MRVAGIDPGTHGALAIIDTDCPGTVFVQNLPTQVITKNSGKKRTRIDLHASVELISTVLNIYGSELVVFIEDINGFGGNQKNTGSSAFVFGMATGAVRGILAAQYAIVHEIAPATWKKKYKLTGKTKDDSRAAAQNFFPSSASQFARVKDADRAEAALIAKFGLEEVIQWRPR